MIMDFQVDTFDQARQLTRRHAKTFYFASHALPPEKRRASYALYAFCRYIDNLADAETDLSLARENLQKVRALLDRMYNPRTQTVPWRALSQTVRRYGIPQQYFIDLVEGVEMDLNGFTCRTFADLHRYAYHVASVVGLMMTKILQPADDDALPYAAHLGTAMQLTNILRDIDEDFRMHRVYLPGDELRQWRIGMDLFHRREVTPDFHGFMQFQVDRARSYYAKAEPGLLLLPDDGSRYCVRAMSLLYSRILDAIEDNGFDVFTRRAHVPFSLKLRLAASLALQGQSRPYIPGNHLLRRQLARRRSRVEQTAIPKATRRALTPRGSSDHE
jgi:15-cis-phytoene synthase